MVKQKLGALGGGFSEETSAVHGAISAETPQERSDYCL